MPQSRELINQKRKLKRHIDRIAMVDPDVANALEEVGYPEPRVRPLGFETFLSIIISQQVSTEAAKSIWNRLCETLPDLQPATVAASPPESLRKAGLSGRKVEYSIGLAENVIAGIFRPNALPDMTDQEVIEHIVAQRGLGQWSAEIYLMFSLQRPDIFAGNDLALQVALQRLKKLDQRPTPNQAREIIEPWKPRRTAGCLFLWHYYRGEPA